MESFFPIFNVQCFVRDVQHYQLVQTTPQINQRKHQEKYVSLGLRGMICVIKRANTHLPKTIQNAVLGDLSYEYAVCEIILPLHNTTQRQSANR